MDDLFLVDPPEWYHGQAMSSAHSAESILVFDMPASYVLFCYPRNGTPVCTKELRKLQRLQNRFNVEVFAASTDSPESHVSFFNNPEAFPLDRPPISYPVLTLNVNILTDFGKKLVLNEFGYCKRIAIVVKDGQVKGIYESENSEERNLYTLADLTNNLIKPREVSQ